MRHPVPYAVGVERRARRARGPVLQRQPRAHRRPRRARSDRSNRAHRPGLRENFASREADALQVSVPALDPTADTAAIDDVRRAARSRSRASRGSTRPPARTASSRASRSRRCSPPSASSRWAAGASSSRPTLVGEELTARFTADGGGRGTWLAVVPDVEPFSAEGEALVEDIRAMDAPFDFAVAGHERAARRHEGRRCSTVLPWVILAIAAGDVRAAVPDDRQPARPAQGAAAERAQPHRDVRRDGVDLPGRPPLGPARLHADRHASTCSRRCSCSASRSGCRWTTRSSCSRASRRSTTSSATTSASVIGRPAEDRPHRRPRRRCCSPSSSSASRRPRSPSSSCSASASTLAVLVDAFLIRATLVPAFMRLAGRLNWWAPAPVRRWHLRCGIWENEPIAVLDRVFDPKA